ncbi:ABC transporter ATP-binding protein [Myceligenerans pegani]|uniref:ABC transporter ATP-binding protein n=1 Tax=Myceligenerans pegani TaxID=2776917 RepID=A0ABR9MU81_9MICO|nr:ABC transporter ATP-binding protein [Myceligenerans sp. TRM 65318]MBE1874938.1 ABC transporter ATP-binding protein [Myceligenerans sp. TRM 65318]MBE3017209.1 ABC transporter ATP-binding protein [Myceligenerans sp. TRM 65318]
MTVEPMIRLDRVSKTYAGAGTPAVAELSLDIAPGEIIVLVGPSGCGKSTTLRLINRMIEPTSGRIHIGGDDVTDVSPDQLRRRIGYVIQQIGLFPHQTIAENVATVPRMLRWDRKRISARVDELLDMVGLDPRLYGNRYPKELSGGQAQRVGVARALGADPSIMLMDEPFGAIDPITRENLQNEFLRLQDELRKTIVFVTHDIDEAVKMGDRIAILGKQSVIHQADTPERILAFPVDEFVRSFIGSGTAMRGLAFEKVGDLDLAPINGEHDGGASSSGSITTESTLYDALEEMLRTASGKAVVVDDDGAPAGYVELSHLSSALRTARDEARLHYEQLAAGGPGA